MLVPFGASETVILLVNGRVPFSRDGKPWSSNTFHELFATLNSIYKLKARELEKASVENCILQLTDSVLQHRSLLKFQEGVERDFRKYFRCERVTLVLVQRHKKYLYRIQKSEKGL